MAQRGDIAVQFAQALPQLLGLPHPSDVFKRPAEELHLHTNSVKYRVQRAIERRGRPIEDDRLDVEVALLLCSLFGDRLLDPVDDGG